MACFQRPVQQNAGVSVLHVCIASTIREVNKLRYHFCAKRGEVESRQLPACKYCLYMHVLQAKKKKNNKKQTNKQKKNKQTKQAAIWQRCLVSPPAVPDPKSRGWTTDDNDRLDMDAWLTTPWSKCCRCCLAGVPVSANFQTVGAFWTNYSAPTYANCRLHKPERGGRGWSGRRRLTVLTLMKNRPWLYCIHPWRLYTNIIWAFAIG